MGSLKGLNDTAQVKRLVVYPTCHAKSKSWVLKH